MALRKPQKDIDDDAEAEVDPNNQFSTNIAILTAAEELPCWKRAKGEEMNPNEG